MKIKTKIYLIFIVYVILLIILGSNLYYTSREMDSSIEKSEISGEIVQNLFGLSILTNDYILYHSERAQEQWQIVYNSLGDVIAHNFPNERNVKHTHTHEEEAILHELHEDFAFTGDLFLQITQSGISDELRDRLVSQILIKSQEMVASAFKLSHLSQRRILKGKGRDNVFNTTFLTAMLILVLIGFYLLISSALKPIKKLMGGTERIGKGDLRHKIEIKGKNEFGDLATAFNQMTTNLEKITASRDELDQEFAARKKVEESLRVSSEILKEAQKMAHLGNWFWDMNTGKVDWSEEVFNIFKLDPKNFIPQIDSIMALSPWPEENKRDQELIKRAIETHEIGTYEQKFLRPDGSIGFYESTFQGVYDSTGKLTAIKGTVLDITKRKQAEVELKNYHEHLEELVKERTKSLLEKTSNYEDSQLALSYLMEDVNEARTELEKANAEAEALNKELEAFSYSVSHDLRAPLRAINGFTRILMEDYIDKFDDEGKRLGSVIQKNSQKMGKLIDDLLAFSRLSRTSMHYSRVDMKNMVIAIYHEATSPKERKRIDFSIPDLPDANCDPNMFRQVWMNLISNAVKFSSKRSQAVISVTYREEETKLIYCINDNGAGFDMTYKNKLFNVFQRLHNEREFPGTGVGLALVQRIIHRHNGDIWAESELDKGAAFYFSLPKK